MNDIEYFTYLFGFIIYASKEHSSVKFRRMDGEKSACGWYENSDLMTITANISRMAIITTITLDQVSYM